MTGVAFSGEYHVDQDKKNVVKFVSNAPIEDFEGITDQNDGDVRLGFMITRLL